MSTNAKWVMWAVAAVIVVGGVWWLTGMNPTAVSPTNSNATPANPAGQNNPSPQAQASSTNANGISTADNSNATLQSNLSNIDTQMNGFTADNASISQSANDQPVSQQSL